MEMKRRVILVVSVVALILWGSISGIIIFCQQQQIAWLYQTKWSSIKTLSQAIQSYDDLYNSEVSYLRQQLLEAENKLKAKENKNGIN